MDDVTVAMPTFIIDELDPRDTFFPTTVGSVNQCKPSDIHIYVIQDLLRNTFFLLCPHLENLLFHTTVSKCT